MNDVVKLVLSITIGIIVVILLFKFLFNISKSFRGLFGFIGKFLGMVFLVLIINNFTGFYEKYSIITWVIIGIVMIISFIKWIKMIIDDIKELKHHIEMRQYVKGVIKKGRKQKKQREKQQLNNAKNLLKEYEENQYKMR